MSPTARSRVLSFFSTLIIVPTLTYFVILFARGYRPDPATKKFEPTGILAATSQPDGAQVIVNNEVKTATDNSLNLPPGVYDVQIKKESFHTWEKKITIGKETVSRATAFLFTNVPTLKAVTTFGASNPSLSPDESKVVFFSPNAKNYDLMYLDLSESPLGLLNHEPRVLTTLASAKFNLRWSPDSRQVLLQSTASARLVDTNSGTISEASIGLPALLADWDFRQHDSDQRQFLALPLALQNFLATCSAQLSWAGSDKKILYTATSSAVMPEQFIPPLPGSDTQPQSRSLIPQHTYIYDLEEDRNFDIGLDSDHWTWYPTSSHVYKLEKTAVIIKEYDNANETVAYAGPLFNSFAIPYPSGKQLLILTNVTPTSSTLPNLYSVNLK